jgi:hypothetical protein
VVPVTQTVIEGDETEVRPEVDATDINLELLAEAMRHIQAKSQNEAINAALEEFVHNWRARRRAAADRLQQMADEGAFDFSKLDEEDR